MTGGCAWNATRTEGAPRHAARIPGARRDAHGEREFAVTRIPAATPTTLLTPASPRICYETLWRAGVTFDVVASDAAPGVRSPLRLRSRIGGVEFTPRTPSPVHEIIDCRLALRLLAWAPKLRRAGVYRLEHYSVYRPGARTASRKVSGHAHALAIDAARFHLVSGAVVDVLRDWEDRERGAHPCEAHPDEAWPSRLMRWVVCDAVAHGLFDVVLTPHHDAAHDNHVHLEVKPNVDWTYVR